MPSVEIIEANIGADVVKSLTLTASDGRTPVTGYTNAATLACSAGYGDTRAAAFAPSVAWDTPSAGTITLTISGSDTATVDPGLYRLYLSITSNGKTRKAQIAFVRLYAVPGATAASATYCSFDDMLRFAPWIIDLITADPAMQSDLAEQRARARSWLDDIIVNRDRPNEWYRYGQTPFDASFSPRWGYGRYGDVFPNTWLRGQLANNRLIVRDMTREITARRAIAYLCESQLGSVALGHASEGTSYQDLANRYLAQAQSLVASYVAELDLTTSNVTATTPSYFVRCGIANSR